ncbi:MAG: DUF1292 domain-containing protein [Candidatus Cloacimonetes bacterium]|nr:DUF1292 domain-containing protein [Candidatus Cloacimonadota bacterium]
MSEEKKKCGCHEDHEHDHDDCNCEEEYDYLTLEFDGEEVQCAIIDEFELDNKKYIVLLPDEEEDAYIYSYTEDEEGGIELINLEEDEFQKAVDEFTKRSEIDE